MAKRSPILGYNHNVRYRGLVFHVQTEDSGLLSPHLFTHLFHEGVIISTRKLVYDAGSAEDAIKGLMQAQHKVVLKDLKRGHFDDKIDIYLANTPGLLPRSEVEEDVADRASAPSIEPVAAAEPVAPPAPSAPAPSVSPPAGRTPTAQRTSSQSAVRTSLQSPPSEESSRHRDFNVDSSPEIEIQLVDDSGDDGVPRDRTARDTDVQTPIDPDITRPTSMSDGIPSEIGAASSRSARESGVPLPPPPERRTGDRASFGAATLPPARPITRPPTRPAMSPPQVVSRPLSADDSRRRAESDAVEVYAPAPSSVDPPPGDRPGEYSQHKRAPTGKMPIVQRERSSSTQIPSGLGRPHRATGANPIVKQAAPAAAPVSPPPTPPPATPPAVVQAVRQPEPSPGVAGSRTVTPSRNSTGPATSRTSSGVVMTRPAVIVGAPAKPAAPRVRKAREEEGRGFGQGLISEKSLDEVILAYLSEDADDNK